MIKRRSRLRLQLSILGAALLATNIVALGVFTWPRVTRVRRAETRAQDVAARTAELEDLWARVAARKTLVAQNRSDIETLRRDRIKPRGADLFAAQREIEKLARDSGLKPIRSTYAVEPVKGTGLVTCAVTLPLDGSYENLISFLDRVESGKRFIVVDQLALSQDEHGAKMNLKLSALFIDDGEPRATR